jgi:cytidine deaminase
MLTDRERDQLVQTAMAASARAYAPYSGLKVGAAALSAGGTVYAGCNVENASYGATLCAERAALSAMVGAGETELSAIAIFTDTEALSMPCGICRQVLSELGGDVEVVVQNAREQRRTTLAELFPEPFRFKP